MPIYSDSDKPGLKVMDERLMMVMIEKVNIATKTTKTLEYMCKPRKL